MSRFKFINIIDTFFISLATMLIIFAWLQFFIKNIIVSLILSAILSVSIMYFFRHIRSKKQERYLNAAAKTTSIAKFKLAIQTISNTKLTLLIKRLISKQYEVKVVKGDIKVVIDNTLHILTTHLNSELTESKLLEIIKTKLSDNLTILCLSVNNDVKSICNAFINKKITLISVEQLYDLFEQKNITIDTSNIDLSKSKITFKEILKGAIKRNKSKGYFFSGLILLLTSLIIPYKIYYVLFSTTLFTLSLICRLKPSSKNVDTTIFN